MEPRKNLMLGSTGLLKTKKKSNLMGGEGHQKLNFIWCRLKKSTSIPVILNGTVLIGQSGKLKTRLTGE